MSSKGADFSDILPRGTQGQLDMLTFTTLPLSSQGVDNGIIFQMTPNNSFRLGQQVLFWIGVANPADPATGQFITRIQLKPWWARPNNEFRQAFGGSGAPGATAAVPYDTQVFGDGVLANPLQDNRYVWVPAQKRLDLTEFLPGPSPPPSPARHSDSLLLQDLWTMDLRPPTDPLYTGKFSAAQTPARWDSLLYPALGYALGFTWEATYDNGALDDIPALGNLSWATGTFGGDSRIQESIG